MEEYSSTLKVGTILVGKYRLDKLLGEGGFGAVYKAYDMGLDRYVAIKECLPCDFAARSADNTTVKAKNQSTVEDFEWAKTRFLEEARTLAKFRSSNLLSANNVFEANGTVYMDSDFIDGTNLEDCLAGNRVCEEDEVLHVFKGILSGLKEVHSFGLMHRDIKPANIIMRASDMQAVLIDFGSARMAVSSKTKPLTAMVTQGYAPFEQYYEDGNQGAWTDIYALAGVCYKMITGEKPPESVARVRSDSIVKLSEAYKGKYSDNLLKLLDQCLAVEEDKRPQSVEECFALLNKAVLGDSLNETPKELLFKEEKSKQDIEFKQFLSMKKLKNMFISGGISFAFSAIISTIISIFIGNTDSYFFEDYGFGIYIEGIFFISLAIGVWGGTIGAVFVEENIKYKIKFSILNILPAYIVICIYSHYFTSDSINPFLWFDIFPFLYCLVLFAFLYLICYRRSFLNLFSYAITAVFALSGLFLAIELYYIMHSSFLFEIIGCSTTLWIITISLFLVPCVYALIYIGEWLGYNLSQFIEKKFRNFKIKT